MLFEDTFERMVKGYCVSKPGIDTYFKYNEKFDSVEQCKKGKPFSGTLIDFMTDEHYKEITAGDDWDLYRLENTPIPIMDFEWVLGIAKEGFFITRKKWKQKNFNKCAFIKDNKVYQKKINKKDKTFTIKEYRLTTEDILAKDWCLYCLND